MNDEIKQTQESIQQEPEGKIEMVRKSIGSGQREIVRATSGRFARSRKKLDRDLQVTEKIENELKALVTRPATDSEGKPIVDKNGKPVPLHIAVAEKLLNMMLELKDEKAIGAAGKTLESILTRAIGKPSDSAVTRDALQHSGIRVVVIPAIPGLPHEEEKPMEALKPPPEWLNAETVSVNEPTNRDVIDPEK